MRLQKFLALALCVSSPLVLRAQNVSTVAGGGSDNVPALSVSIGGPEAVVKDAAGNTYILDNFFSRILKVNAIGVLTVLAGNGTNGFSGDGAPAAGAQLHGPSAMFMDASGNFFIADSDNSVIREIPAVSGTHYGINMTAGNIYTIAGVAGSLDYNGDGIPATTAFLNVPDGVFVDGVGNVFIGDRFNHIVRELANVSTGGKTAGNIYTIAGTIPTGTSPHTVPQPGFAGDGGPATGAKLHDPWGLYGDSSGNLFIADSSNCLIRVVAPTGTIATFAGTVPVPSTNPPVCGSTGDQGLATAAQLKTPHGVFLDAANDLFISDYENHAIREVPFATTVTPPMTAGHIYTIAGTLGAKGNSVDGTPAKTAGLAHPSNVFFDASGSLFIADSDAATIREVPSASGTNYTVLMTAGDIYTIAGNGFLSFGGDGAVATNAELNAPFAPTNAIGTATDATGNLFIADTSNDVIREVTVADGFIHTIVGAAGFDAFSGDGGPAASAHINNPNGVFVDSHNNIFIADTGNCLIREVVASTGKITTFAGTAPAPSTPPSPPNPPVCGPSGDQGPATTAQLKAPNTVFVDGSGNVFIADTLNHAIREIPAKTTTDTNGKTAGNIYTVAGTLNMSGPSANGVLATAALLSGPQGIFVDSLGNLFIADTQNQVIREVPAQTGTNYGISMTAGNIYTVAGTPQTGGFGGDTGPATSAKLLSPFGVLVDAAGNLFISDTGNHLIREVAAITGSGKTAGGIYTVAGTPPPAVPVVPVGGFGGDGGPAIGAKFNGPQGLAAGVSGNLLLADSNNVRIRSVANLLTNVAIGFSPSSLTFTTQLVGAPSAAQTVTLTNNGTAPLSITSIVVGGTNSGDFTETNTCGTSVSASAKCAISVTFTPKATGTRTASITITDSVPGSPQTFSLTGAGIAVSLAVTSGSSATQTVKAGQTATYNMQLSAAGGAATDQLMVSISCAGAPSLSTCSGPAAPVVVTPAAPATFSITVTTTGSAVLAPGVQFEPKMWSPTAIQTLPVAIMALLLFVAALLSWTQGPAGRLRTVRLALSICLVLLPLSAAALLIGCGGGSSSPTPTPTPKPSTPSGTYTLTVTATTSGKAQTTQLTLVVQ
jgi:sugar lactone lactonase YvrE